MTPLLASPLFYTAGAEGEGDKLKSSSTSNQIGAFNRMAQNGGFRVLIKLSGEALMGNREYGLDPAMLAEVAGDLIATRQEIGAELALVVGGGNIFRGMAGAAKGMNRSTADQMGMLATVINALALQDALITAGATVLVQSALAMPQVAAGFNRQTAMAALASGQMVIFAGGTGNPFFTTDTAAALRAAEIQADLLLKATKVDGIYDADPKKIANAKRFDRLSYDEALRRDLKVMDATAFTLCREVSLPIMVCSIMERGALIAALRSYRTGDPTAWRGTVVDAF